MGDDVSERKELGKITHATFGLGGYQDAQIGLSLTFGGSGWGCSTFRGDWAIDRSEHAKWTENDRIRQLGETVMWLRDILRKAKVDCVGNLVGIPVECTFDGNVLKEWRVLEEVL